MEGAILTGAHFLQIMSGTERLAVGSNDYDPNCLITVDVIECDLQSIEHRVLETQGLIEIETDDVNASLQQLATHVTGLNRLKIRQPNLEDLFLDLTGHSLRA